MSGKRPGTCATTAFWWLKPIRRLMRLMGLVPIYQKPKASRPAEVKKIYLYLLKGLRVRG